jgi:hypothetical protein
MFSKPAASVVEPTHDDVVVAVDPADLIPLSHLELDLPAPTTGWLIELDRRGVEIALDDLGRRSISRDAARQLLAEQHENEARRREAAERQERAAVEADRVRRASIWGGIPADHLPVGVSAASAMFAADRAARPRRESPLQHALSNEGGIVFHPIHGDEDQS